MTQSEFIRNYCQKSDTSEKKLNELGLFAVPYDCGNEDCDGWAMISRENAKTHLNLYVSEEPNRDIKSPGFYKVSEGYNPKGTGKVDSNEK